MNTTIMINTQTRDLLRNIGKKDDTYDQIIINLIKAGAYKVEEKVKEEYIKKINAICDNHEKKYGIKGGTNLSQLRKEIELSD